MMIHSDITDRDEEIKEAHQSLQQRPPMRKLDAISRLVLAVALLLIFGVGLFAGWEFGRGAPLPNTQPSAAGITGNGSSSTGLLPAKADPIVAAREAVLAKIQPSVVQVNVELPQGAGIGSGVIIDKQGYIVTNNHVVTDAQSIEVVLFNGQRQTAQVVGSDPSNDLAVLKIAPPRSLVVAPFGDSSKLHVGDEVLAIGNPLGITQTVTHGIISALNRRVSEGKGGASIHDAIQTDAPN
jgi:S1-C subfamily serine protease